MYMNLKPNQHERISFNARTITSLGFIAPPVKFSTSQIEFFAQFPPPKKIRGRGAATMLVYVPNINRS